MHTALYILAAAYLGFGVLVGLSCAGFVAIGAAMSGRESRGPSLIGAFLVGLLFWPIIALLMAKT